LVFGPYRFYFEKEISGHYDPSLGTLVYMIVAPEPMEELVTASEAFLFLLGVFLPKRMLSSLGN